MELKMKKKVISGLLAAAGLVAGLAAPSLAYPERPESARCWYEFEYFPCRLLSCAVTTAWDVPTAWFQDGVKGAIGGTKMVARNLGKEDGTYELVAGGVSGGPAGFAAGSTYGLFHGFVYGIHHGYTTALLAIQAHIAAATA
jgi:hypothetical protein